MGKARTLVGEGWRRKKNGGKKLGEEEEEEKESGKGDGDGGGE